MGKVKGAAAGAYPESKLNFEKTLKPKSEGRTHHIFAVNVDALAKQARDLRVVTTSRGTDKRVLIRLCMCVHDDTGSFLWWSGGVQCRKRKESHRAGDPKRNHKRVQQALLGLKGLNQRAVTKGRRRGGSNGISILPFGAWSRARDRGWQAL